jgi:brefeldin A-resistance guanine nucleotide exchange factor 1
VLLSDESICKAVQAAFMLGDPVTKPKEYGDIMAFYSRQSCGRMIRTVFTNVAQDMMAQQAALDAGEVGRNNCFI